MHDIKVEDMRHGYKNYHRVFSFKPVVFEILLNKVIKIVNLGDIFFEVSFDFKTKSIQNNLEIIVALGAFLFLF